MRRSYLLEYTILLVICFFAVRTCMSEKQVNSDLKTENTAISDSTDLYKEKYGREHAEKQALLDTMQVAVKHTKDSLSHILNVFRKQVEDASALVNAIMFIHADTSYAGSLEVIRFQYGNKWATASGLLVITPIQYDSSKCTLPIAMTGLKQITSCGSCHKHTNDSSLYSCMR